MSKNKGYSKSHKMSGSSSRAVAGYKKGKAMGSIQWKGSMSKPSKSTGSAGSISKRGK